jgi:hypothetical protein
MVVLSLLAETPADIAFYWRMRSPVDLALMALTFALTLVWNVQTGVVVSVLVSLLLVVRRSARTRMTILVRLSFSLVARVCVWADREHRDAYPARRRGSPSTRTPRPRRTCRARSSCASARASISVRRTRALLSLSPRR